MIMYTHLLFFLSSENPNRAIGIQMTVGSTYPSLFTNEDVIKQPKLARIQQ